MLKSKRLRLEGTEEESKHSNPVISIVLSPYFTKPLWKQFHDIEVELNTELANFKMENKTITHVYNCVDYTSEIHCAYLRKYLTGTKKLLFIGMNPGPNGMAQTGVPFGNVQTVKNFMKLSGNVNAPQNVHSNRQITGLNCTIEEPSGVKFWNSIVEASTNLEIFFNQCFVHNFCPLIFFNSTGANITPSELKGNDKKEIRNICLKYLQNELQILKPEILVAVGSYVYDSLKPLAKTMPNVTILKLPHPSPRALNNANWPDKARIFYDSNNLIHYMKNE